MLLASKSFYLHKSPVVFDIDSRKGRAYSCLVKSVVVLVSYLSLYFMCACELTANYCTVVLREHISWLINNLCIAYCIHFT